MSEQERILAAVQEMMAGAGGFIAVQVLAKEMRRLARDERVTIAIACEALDDIATVSNQAKTAEEVTAVQASTADIPMRHVPREFVGVLQQHYGERFSWENAKHGLTQLARFAGMLKEELQKPESEG